MTKENGRWEKGQSGNPKGRVKGQRVLLNEAFVKDLKSAWDEFGADGMKDLAKDNFAEFAKLAVKLQPKEVDAKIDATDELKQAMGLIDGDTKGIK